MHPHIRIVSLDDRHSWHTIQSRSGLGSHSWEFNQALSCSGIVPKLALVETEDNSLIFPFYERSWSNHVDICTTLSVSGAVMRPVARSDLLSAWAEFGAANGWVAGYLQFEPETSMCGIADAAPGNQIFLLDISRTDLLAGASSEIRRKIRRAKKLGVNLVEDRRALAKALQRLYPVTMARSGALAHYLFSSRTLELWTLDPGSLVIGAASGSEIEALSIFPYLGERAEYYITASSTEGRGLTAWLLWQGILRLQELGVRTLNLGGGVRPQDGLYQFKEKFGGRMAPLHAVRQIYQPGTYQRLCREANVPVGTTWFPAYRVGREALSILV
jgi:hypothetical protein